MQYAYMSMRGKRQAEDCTTVMVRSWKVPSFVVAIYVPTCKNIDISADSETQTMARDNQIKTAKDTGWISG